VGPQRVDVDHVSTARRLVRLAVAGRVKHGVAEPELVTAAARSRAPNSSTPYSTSLHRPVPQPRFKSSRFRFELLRIRRVRARREGIATSVRRARRILGTAFVALGIAAIACARRLALAGPVHGPLHEVRAGTARARLRPFSRPLPPAAAPARLAGWRPARGCAGSASVQARDAPRRGYRPDRRGPPRAQHGLRRRHGRELAQERARPRSAVIHAGTAAARLHRGAPHDLPGSVLPHRAPEERRFRPARDALRDVYRISGHRIVRADNLSVLRSPRHELLELRACHPRFFASHRYIAYALPVRVRPRDGRAYAVSVAERSYTQSGA